MTKMDAKVSVVLTTYNRPKLLERSLESVARQTFQEWECIVVDDASEDKVEDIVEKYADPRIRYHRHEKNKGLSAARNTGLRLAEAPMVAFLDDDDEWLPRKLEKQVQCMEQAESEVALVHCWMETVRDGNVVESKCPELRGDIFKQTFDRQPLGNGSTWLLRRAAALEKGGFDESLPRGVDGDFLRRFCSSYEVEYVSECLVRYNIEHGKKRMTRLEDGGAKNAVISEETKLSKFNSFFNSHPVIEARVRSGLAYYHAVDRNYHDSYDNYKKAILLAPLEVKVYWDLVRGSVNVIRQKCKYV